MAGWNRAKRQKKPQYIVTAMLRVCAGFVKCGYVAVRLCDMPVKEAFTPHPSITVPNLVYQGLQTD
jgi:hypothetical protein